MNDDDYRPRQEPKASNMTRRERTAARRGPSKAGGISAACGCRYVYTGGYWYHVTGGHGHHLREWPVTDENMTTLLAA